MRRHGPQAEMETLGRWRKRARLRPGAAPIVDPALVRGIMDSGASRVDIARMIERARRRE